ncbi:hypothetical protein Tco_1061729 [Tanacetum coccineum]
MIYLAMSWLVDVVAATAVDAGVHNMVAFFAAIVLKAAYFPLLPLVVGVSKIYVMGLSWIWDTCWARPISCKWIGSCTKSSDLDDCLHNESKPLALPWGRTPRLDSDVRVREHVVRDMCVRSGTLVGQGSVIIVIAAANYLPRTLVNPLQCIAEAE